MKLTLWEIMHMGGLAMWIIIACSVIAIAIFLERMMTLWAFMARARGLAETVNRCLFRNAVAEARAACERSKSPLADIFLVGFERWGRGSRMAVEQAVERERQRVILDLRARLWILGTIGATAPFVGLYGTVVGIMNAFHAISQQGGGGFAVVSKGISEALVTTAAGILVAVEAVALYNYFQQRLSRLAMEMKLFAEEFIEVISGEGTPHDASLAAKTVANSASDPVSVIRRAQDVGEAEA